MLQYIYGKLHAYHVSILLQRCVSSHPHHHHYHHRTRTRLVCCCGPTSDATLSCRASESARGAATPLRGALPVLLRVFRVRRVVVVEGASEVNVRGEVRGMHSCAAPATGESMVGARGCCTAERVVRAGEARSLASRLRLVPRRATSSSSSSWSCMSCISASGVILRRRTETGFGVGVGVGLVCGWVVFCVGIKKHTVRCFSTMPVSSKHLYVCRMNEAGFLMEDTISCGNACKNRSTACTRRPCGDAILDSASI